MIVMLAVLSLPLYSFALCKWRSILMRQRRVLDGGSDSRPNIEDSARFNSIVEKQLCVFGD